MGVSNFLKMFDKLDDIVYEPIEVLGDWAREPLERMEEERERTRREREHERNEKTKDRDVEREIRRQTGITEAIVELEEMKKDAELQRRKEIAQAVQEYQETLMRINKDAVRDLGEMQINLKEKAEKMIEERVKEYNEMQDQSIEKAQKQLVQVKEEFSDDERMREVMVDGIEKKMKNIINTADRFVQRLDESIRELSDNLDVLSKQGHHYVLQNIQEFRAMNDREGAQALLEENWEEVREEIPEDTQEEWIAEE